MSPGMFDKARAFFEANPDETIYPIGTRGRIRRKPRVIAIDDGKLSTRLMLLAAYGGGLIKQAQIAGEYPPPPVDMPEMPETPAKSTLSAGSGTITGRWTTTKPPFHELYGGKPVKLADHRAQMTAAAVDYAEIEKRLLAQGWVRGEGAAWDEWTKEEDDATE